MVIATQIIRNYDFYSIGGSTCSGKSTIAQMLIDKYAWNSYKADDFLPQHLEKSSSEIHPTLHKLSKLTWNEIWMRPLHEQIEDVFQGYHEESLMIMEDLLAYPSDKPILLEGMAFLPELAKQLKLQKDRVVFLVPSAEFQVEHYKQREWIHEIVNQCDNPSQAFSNWMQRDIACSQRMKERAEEIGYKVIVVDGSQTVMEIFTEVEAHFLQNKQLP